MSANVLGDPGWDGRTEKGAQVKTKELGIKYGLQSVVVYQYSFIICHKSTTGR